MLPTSFRTRVTRRMLALAALVGAIVLVLSPPADSAVPVDASVSTPSPMAAVCAAA